MKVWAGPEYIPTSVVESKGEEKKKENIQTARRAGNEDTA
jgi:hypothetical protein